MRYHRIVAVAALCVVPATAVFAATRKKIACANVSLTELKPGWGPMPPALQKLPPKANLCGVNGANVVFITSELDLGALQKFYEPLFASLGCKPLTVKIGAFKMKKLICPKAGDAQAGFVDAQTYDQAYQLGFSAN